MYDFKESNAGKDKEQKVKATTMMAMGRVYRSIEQYAIHIITEIMEQIVIHSDDEGKRNHGKSRFWNGVVSLREPKKCKTILKYRYEEWPWWTIMSSIT